jgi:protein-S-isoprenylcysteine O-methyltransferase Ste14
MALQEELEKQGNWLFRNRSTLPLIVVFAGIFVFIWTEYHPENYWLKNEDIRHYVTWFCILISMIGLAIRVFTVGYTPANTSGRNTANQLADELNTTGIYSVVRHPLYLGNFFMWLGPVVLTGQLWFVAVVCLFYWVYYERIMFAEEQFLRRKFGEVYTSWAAKVPAFIPEWGKYVKSALPFSWKKVLKKEKNGLVNVFAIFCLMDSLGVMISKTGNYDYVLIGGCFFTILLYFILKFLKYKTNLLNEAGR